MLYHMPVMNYYVTETSGLGKIYNSRQVVAAFGYEQDAIEYSKSSRMTASAKRGNFITVIKADQLK